MKKLLLLVLLGLFLVGCKKEDLNTVVAPTITPTTVPTSTPVPTEAPKIDLSADQVITELKKSILSVDKVIVYTEETDENDLLGRPNQYTSKINFADSRLEQYDIETDPNGGTIEVFDNHEDAQTRYDYLETVTKGVSWAQQYMYISDKTVFRLTYDLTPAQAKEYETAILSIIE